MPEQDPLSDFLGDVAKKIKVAKEHKDIMEAVYTAASATEIVKEQEDPFAGFLKKISNTISAKLPPKEMVQENIEPENKPSQQAAEQLGRKIKEVIETAKNKQETQIEEPEKTEVENNIPVSNLEPVSEPEDQNKSAKALAQKIKDAIETAKTTVLADPQQTADDSQVSSYINELEKIKDTGTAQQKEEATTSLKELRKYIDKTVQDYARRILDLGSGGGTVAVQYANGGTMNGDLNVTGNYLSAGVNLLNIFSGGGGGGGDNQTLSFNELSSGLSISNGNTVSLSSLKVGDIAVNTLVHVNSANWNAAYTNLITNSAAYLLSGTSVDLGQIPTLSSNWNSSYSTTNTNSANWSDTYTTVQNNSASWGSGGSPSVTGFVRLSGDTMTGSLSTPSLSADSIWLKGKLRITSNNVTNNVFIGDSSTGNDNATGNHNFVFGISAGDTLTTGAHNTFIGQRAGACNTTGSNNNFIGACAGQNNTTGNSNNFFGLSAGITNTIGSNNTIIGNRADIATNSLSGVIAIGTGAIATQTNQIVLSTANISIRSLNGIAGPNLFIGDSSTGNNNATASHNFVVGIGAGSSLTTGGSNVFIGRCTGNRNTNTFNNIFIGARAGQYNSSGGFNNFFGYLAGLCNTGGSGNNFFGQQAGNDNTTGCNNNFLGYLVGRFSTTGSNNNFFGTRAGFRNTSGTRNNIIGFNSGIYNSTGSFNNFIGNLAGCNNTIGSNNTIIGNQANVATNSLSGVIVIGTGAIASDNNQWAMGSNTWPLSTTTTAGTLKEYAVINWNGTLRKIALLDV